MVTPQIKKEQCGLRHNNRVLDQLNTRSLIKGAMSFG